MENKGGVFLWVIGRSLLIGLCVGAVSGAAVGGSVYLLGLLNPTFRHEMFSGLPIVVFVSAVSGLMIGAAVGTVLGLINGLALACVTARWLGSAGDNRERYCITAMVTSVALTLLTVIVPFRDWWRLAFVMEGWGAASLMSLFVAAAAWGGRRVFRDQMAIPKGDPAISVSENVAFGLRLLAFSVVGIVAVLGVAILAHRH